MNEKGKKVHYNGTEAQRAREDELPNADTEETRSRRAREASG